MRRRWRTRCCGTLFPHGIRRFAQLFSSGHPTNGNPLRRRETKSPPFSLRASRAWKRTEEGTREGTRERGPSRGTQFAALSIPFSAHPTAVLCTHVDRQDLSTLWETKRQSFASTRETLSRRYYDFHLAPCNFRFPTLCRRIRQSDTLLHSFRDRSYSVQLYIQAKAIHPFQ